MRQCGQCRQATLPGAVFCHHCGHRLVATSTPRVLRRERKWVSILFADVRGSLSLIADLDPEYAHELLNPIIQVMKAAVERNGGVVNRVTGDGIMALFGAPIGIEDHAVRACAAALEMVRLVADRKLSDAHGQGQIEIRVGINTGEVLVHPTVSFGSVFYDATGEAVHLAARMEQCAQANQAFVSAHTFAQTMGEIEADDLGEIPVKGLEAPVRAFHLTRLSSRWRSRSAVLSGRKSLFVGRYEEVAKLRDLQEQAEEGRGNAIQFTGDAGSGKSRLIEEFTVQLNREIWHVHHCQSQRHRKTGFRGIADLLERLSGLDFGSTNLASGDMSWLPMKTPKEDRVALAVILGLSDGDIVWKGMEPRERKERLDQATLRLLNNLCAAQPTLFIVEDAHWLDEDSAALFAKFCASVGRSSALLIVTSRGEAEFGSTRLPIQIEHHLSPLSKDDSRTILRAVLRRGRGVETLEEKLIELTQGNPLFLEECLYSLLSTGAVRQEDGEYVLAEPITDLRVPTSLRGLIASRVDRVAQEDKNILQAAAVVGTSVPRSMLANLAQQDIENLQTSVDRLCRDGFLVSQPGVALSFRHGLTREAVYESIPIRQRLAMHAAILSLVETWEGDHVELLADHALRGHLFQKAADYCRKSGNKAFQRDAKDEAIRFLRQGLDAAEHWPSGQDKSRMQFDLHLDLRNPLFQLARIEELAEHINQAMPIATSLRDPIRLGRYYPYVSHLSWFRGNPDAALEAVQATLRIASANGDAAMAARAKFQEGTIWMSQSRIAEAVEAMSSVLAYLGANVEEYQYGVNASLAVTTLSYIARAQADGGNSAAAWDAASQALSIAERLKNPFASAFADTGLGYCHLRVGKATEALDFLERAYQASTAGDAPLMIPVSASFLGWALVETGQLERGVKFAALAVTKADEIGFRVFQPIRLFIWAHALAVAGNITEAKCRAEDAIKLAEGQKEFGAKAHALKVLGEIQLIEGNKVAVATLRAGYDLAKAYSLFPLARGFEATLQRMSMATAFDTEC